VTVTCRPTARRLRRSLLGTGSFVYDVNYELETTKKDLADQIDDAAKNCCNTAPAVSCTAADLCPAAKAKVKTDKGVDIVITDGAGTVAVDPSGGGKSEPQRGGRAARCVWRPRGRQCAGEGARCAPAPQGPAPTQPTLHPGSPPTPLPLPCAPPPPSRSLRGERVLEGPRRQRDLRGLRRGRVLGGRRQRLRLRLGQVAVLWKRLHVR
jgi:hypothetical protein